MPPTVVDSSLDQLVYNRRSIRKWEPTEISSEMEEKLLDLAIHVASPTFSQPLRIVSFKSAESRTALAEALKRGFERTLEAAADDPKAQKSAKFFYRFSTPMFDAPLLWAIQSMPPKRPNPHSVISNSLSIGCSLQNIFLKAEEWGLKGCLYGAPLHFLKQTDIPTKKIQIEDKEFTPETLIFLTLGKPAEKANPLTRLTPKEIFTEV